MLLLFAFVASIGSAASMSPFSNDDILRINPSYKLERMSNGEVIIHTGVEQGVKESHSFHDFYADLLLAAHRKQRMEYVLQTLSNKYYLSDDECRRELKHALNVLSEWNIVLLDKVTASR